MRRLKQVSKARKDQQANQTQTNELWAGSQNLIFYGFNSRMLPDHITPKCVFRKLEERRVTLAKKSVKKRASSKPDKFAKQPR